MIKRTIYLDKISQYRDMKLIKIITGIRRSGKSVLMKMYIDSLLSCGIDKSQIIFINLEEIENEELKDSHKLYYYIKERLVSDKMTYIFIDEIQECRDFQIAVNSLFVKDNVDLYITGSNAYLLSGELATYLSGRYVTIEVLPLSFKEYISVVGEDNAENKFRDYLRYGSFPYVLQFNKNEEMITNYLEGLFNTIFIKDVLFRNKIDNKNLLLNLIKFLFDNIGNITSTKKIEDTLLSNGNKVSQPTIDGYLKALQDSYIIYKVDRFDIKGKEYLKTLSKYYVVDIGMRGYLLGYKDIDRGFILENIVYLELRRRGYKVYIGKIGDQEVDFVVLKGNEIIYIQVSESIKDPLIFNREIKSLKMIKDSFKKVIISTDYDANEYYNGIKHINLFDFLLDKVDL